MKRTVCIGLGTLASILLAACAQIDPALQREIAEAIQRGAEERPSGRQVNLPTLGQQATPQPLGRQVNLPTLAQQVTLPPEWTPTASPLPRAEPSAQLSPEAPSDLTAAGPWLLYCGRDGQAALMNVNGPGWLATGAPCLPPRQISGPAGMAIANQGLIQLPGGEQIREACCQTAGWSADGNLALLSDADSRPDGSALYLYDVAADRFQPLVDSDFQLIPMGLSPGGTWAVYLDRDEFEGNRLPPAQVMAVSTDGRQQWKLYGLYGDDVRGDTVLGWLSESYLLIQRVNGTCNLEPEHYELLVANLNRGSARHIFDKHAYIAFDPVTQTILLEELPREPCALGQRGPLVRLSALDGWQPHPVALPAEWGDDWAVSLIEWHPELGQFSVRAGENRGGAPLHLITLNPDGTIVQEFPLQGAQIVTSARLFPSPDGSWIVVAASSPHGTRLYDRDGRLVRTLALDGPELSYGVRQVLWLPEGDVFFMTDPESPGVFRASARQGWQPELVEPWAAAGSPLTLVEAPDLPFQEVCGGQAYSRLQVGDRVMVSHEPPLSSRLRLGPDLSELESGMLAPGDLAAITAGPVCADGYVWWKVRAEHANLSGWTVEGDAKGAWLLALEGSGRP